MIGGVSRSENLRRRCRRLLRRRHIQFAPQTVAHIVELAQAGAYDTTHFYRVERGFVAQTALIRDRTMPLTPVLPLHQVTAPRPLFQPELSTT